MTHLFNWKLKRNKWKMYLFYDYMIIQYPTSKVINKLKYELSLFN